MLQGAESIIRSNSFKYRNFQKTELKKIAPYVIRQLQFLKKNYESQHLSPAETASIYLFVLLIWKNSTQWLSGSNHEPRIAGSLLAHRSSIALSEVVDLISHSAPHEIALLQYLQRGLAKLPKSSESLFDFINKSKFKGVPESAIKSLLFWQSEEYPLVLLDYVPTPLELFKLQCTGKRCVTLLFEENEISDFVENGRDILGFVLHDLIHADHFYHNKILARSQIGFSRFIYKAFTTHVFSDYLKDPIFKKDFYYIVSDMNSHPIHLLQTLKAQQLFAYKRSKGVRSNQRLSTTLESEFEIAFARQFVTWALTEQESLSLAKINQLDFSNLDSQILEEFFLKVSDLQFAI